MKKKLLGVLVGLPLGLALACGDTQDPTGPGGAGAVAGATDTGNAGADTSAAGTSKGGTPNGGSASAGAANAGGNDAGTANTGGTDAGTANSGGTDAGGAGAAAGGTPSAEAGAGGAADAAAGAGGQGSTGDAGAGGGAPDGPVPIAQAAQGELVISEIMYNSLAVDDSVGEWFEVYNATSHAFDLAGLTLADGTGSLSIPSSLIIEAHDYAVFARSGGAGNGGVSADFVYGDVIQLSNGSDTVKLSIGATVLDTVGYDAAFPGFAGASMSVVGASPSALANDSAANWCDSGRRFGKGDLGSPGAPNSCVRAAASLAAGELVVTEIMANPTKVSDLAGEWFELYNASLDAFELKGLVVHDAGIDSFSVATSLLILPGDRRVFGVNGSSNANGGVTVDYVYAQAALALANGPDELILGTGVVVDSVVFDASKFPAGASISLSPTATSATANDLASNWCKSTTVYGAGDFGTPRAVNDACP